MIADHSFARIAYVEDDDTLASTIGTALRGAGYSEHHFGSAEALLRELQVSNFDLIMLDWNLPGMSGHDLVKKLRDGLGIESPVMMMTCHDDEADIVSALSRGADDYVLKPCAPPILLARIRAMLRRTMTDEGQDAALTLGHVSFPPDSTTVLVDGEPLELTAKERALARILCANEGRALTRSYLLEAVWGRNPNLPTRTIDAHISRIRNKLNLRPERGMKLSSIYGQGYRLEYIR